jgi:SAM-dependent methyltransferase
VQEKGVDFGRTAEHYGRHRPVFPDAFFVRLSAYGIGRQGQRILDLGTGTGTIARAFASRGSEVTGIDVSESMLEEAERLGRDAGVSVMYSVAKAEETGLPDRSFDAVSAGQCWHWFDRPRAAEEARRVLRPGGKLVIAHFDPIPLPGNVMEATADLIGRHNPKYGETANQTGFYPDWLEGVAVAGFEDIETFSFDVHVPHTHEGWRGRLRASAAVGASMQPEETERFDAELAELLRERFSEEPLMVRHRVFAVVCSAPS